jgi:colanic acid/amylovoran biosynthesis glycosyltransferase
MFRFARRLWNAPLIVSFHGYDYTSLPRQQGPGLYARLFPSTDAITVNSDYAGRALQQLGCPGTKIHRLNYGIDLSEFDFRERHPQPGAPIQVLTVGRLVEKKGIKESIRAFVRALTRYPNARYDIIGDGPMRAELTALIEELGASGRIALKGALNGDEVRQAMASAHLFVLTSVTAADGDQEGTPVSLLEAQATGLPVVSTAHSGIPEIVADQQSGYLVPERDVATLADRLVHLFEHPDIWPRMGRHGRRLMEERHDIRQLNLALSDLYERVVTAHAGR